jgi:hypothetical protein
MRIESWVGVTAVCLVASGGAICAESGRCTGSKLPANVELVSNIGRLLEQVYDRSPTFRAQCARIANAPNLRVRVRIDPSISSRFRAFTVVSRSGFEIRAEVHLPPSSDHSELVAHEFEHLLEQIEGLNLQRLVRVKGSGVHEVERALFETDRAQAAGRVVLEETQRWRRTPAAD